MRPASKRQAQRQEELPALAARFLGNGLGPEPPSGLIPRMRGEQRGGDGKKSVTGYETDTTINVTVNSAVLAAAKSGGKHAIYKLD